MNNFDENKDLDNNDELKQEPENVTREINLDELYDGVVNNTVVIDPVTNDEVLLKTKKKNFPFLGVIIAIIILLLLYFVNKTFDLSSTTKEVKPQTTKELVVTHIEEKKGSLNCTYSSKSDSDTQTLTYNAYYENDKIINSEFDYVVVSSNDNISDVINNLIDQYETFYINNVSILGNNVSFEKNDKGFTFNVKTEYEKAKFEDIKVIDGQTVLYLKPSATDTIDSLKASYENKGFSCSIVENNE